MVSPKVRNENSDIVKRRRRQPVQTENSVGKRVIELLGDRDFGWLSGKTGIPASTLSDYVQRGISRADNAVKIARALDTTVEHLIDGIEAPSIRRHLVEASDAEWVDVPEYSLFEIDEHGKLAPIVTTKMRKDWLYSSLGETSGLWIAAAPARYEALGIEPMTMIFCKDHRPGERMIHGVHYLFRINGGVIIARFALREDANEEPTVLPREIGHEDDQHQVVARIVGQFARPI
ncbi:MAG: helix-turn-helix transcriptional regulator [Sphingopyxis terrae]|nr:helix-turn-helix transcriptional regulator [Sphingopyxis terrae]